MHRINLLPVALALSVSASRLLAQSTPTGAPEPTTGPGGTGAQLAADSAAMDTTGDGTATSSSTAGIAAGGAVGNIDLGDQLLGSTFSSEADRFTGKFTCKVPIIVPPARQGSQPSLAMHYSSGSGNGWCGMGWSLEVGYIQRDVRKGVPIQWAPSSATPLKQYDDAKGFVANLDGVSSRLLEVSGQNPRIFHQQVETGFMTYKLFNNNHWEVVDKSGKTFYFGDTPASRMENPKAGWTAGATASTFRWALDKIVDANGNVTLFTYTTDGGLLYLSQVAYNGNNNFASPQPPPNTSHTIDFVPETSNRPDTNISFMGGYRLTSQKRLSEIRIKVSGRQVRKYVLGYTISSSTKRSLLRSITQYGSDFTNALPPLTFNYQSKSFSFGPETLWSGLYGWNDPSGFKPWSYITRREGSGLNGFDVETIDIDGDGLPDHVTCGAAAYRDLGPPLSVQRNTGLWFDLKYSWVPFTAPAPSWANISTMNSDGATLSALIDINGDGYPDHVERGSETNLGSFRVQLNTGTGFTGVSTWGPIINTETTAPNWMCPRYKNLVTMTDMNGDGLPDRVSRLVNGTTFERFKVQLNTGSGFTYPVDWYPVGSQGKTGGGWNGVSATDDNGNKYVILQDVNGDGLPDRVIQLAKPPYTNFFVQFNNGAGFETAELWGPIDNQLEPSSVGWGAPIGTDGQKVWSTLVDINGDGLPDRVMRVRTAPYNHWLVQINTGSGFAPSVSWGPVSRQGATTTAAADISSTSTTGSGAQDTEVDLFDIDGDGLPDRVMWDKSNNGGLIVQFNSGQMPDLLNSVANGIGGTVNISYVPSTHWDNRNKDWTSDPWNEGAKSLLPFVIYTVSQISASDGRGNTSQTTYAFKGGYYNSAQREFRGFARCDATDSYGTLTRTYFHQGGGRDYSALGQYLDQNPISSKKGLPFRTELIGNDGKLNSVTLNKVEEVMLDSSGRYFPFVSQTIVMNYEGLANYRAKAKQFTYDNSTGNLVMEADLGEVAGVAPATHTFTDVSDGSIYSWTTYAANLVAIVNRPSDVKITSDSAGNSRLREEQFTYDSRGNLKGSQVWLDTAGSFITTMAAIYDQYGNATNVTDAAQITTSTIFDLTYEQYPLTNITATFTNSIVPDPLSGQTIMAVDPKGFTVSNYFDVFFRFKGNYVSTDSVNTFPTLWKTKCDYTLGGTPGGISANCLHKQVNDAVDSVNGFETFTYYDGLARPIQTRAEAENGQFRVSDTVYDNRGNPQFVTRPYFAYGSAYGFVNGSYPYVGTYTGYDSVGRANQVQSGVVATVNLGHLTSAQASGGDQPGSPIAPTTTAFCDSSNPSNPWAVVVTDPGGLVKKALHDARGRVITKKEVTSAGTYTASYQYDLLGNLIQLTDNAANSTIVAWDSLGRKISTSDPDMGTWTYQYDSANRLTQQTDARNNVVKFSYSDPIGRLTSRKIYDANAQLVGTISYTYDVSDDTANYTVFKGQLYKVTDLQGYERSSYDFRGRVLKKARFFNNPNNAAVLGFNANEYVTKATYDDADRISTLTYPDGVASIQYVYDTAGNLSQVKSLSGTGAPVTFYTANGFNALGQITGYVNGNGVASSFSYYPNSSRLQNVTTASGSATFQNLAYTYDTMSNIKSVGDGVYTGNASAAINNIVYDGLYRLVSLNSTARGSRSYSYDSIGNMLSNQDASSGTYAYGSSQPHAVTSVNGEGYYYDACGNMTYRGSQTLAYDEQNQLASVSDKASIVTFGYDYAGQRLWRCDASGCSLWIGGQYEVNNGRKLCHVFAGSQLVASFEPSSVLSKVVGERRWVAATGWLDRILDWPFQRGRTPFSLLFMMLAGIFGIWLAARRTLGLAVAGPRPLGWRRRSFGHRATAFASLTALILATTNTNVEAQTYTPVFYYYHPDRLGSSNILTDRLGQSVQHYEYASFGQTTYTANASAFPISNRYTSQIADDGTGLYYFGGRYYDPQLGRFTQPDPTIPHAGDSQSLNRYSYCRNNPLNSVDPSGYSDSVLDLSSDYNPVGGGNWWGSLFGSMSMAPEGGDYVSAYQATMADMQNTMSFGGGGSGDYSIGQSFSSLLNMVPGVGAIKMAVEQGYTGTDLVTGQSVDQMSPLGLTAAVGLNLLSAYPFAAGMMAEAAAGAQFSARSVIMGGVSSLETAAAEESTVLGNGAHAPVSGSQWNGYFAEKSGAGSVEWVQPRPSVSVSQSYARPSGATTPLQRYSVQGLPCVDCGQTASRMIANHQYPLVMEYYETGSVNLSRMRSLDAVNAQCPTCSSQQGWVMRNYSIYMRGLNGL